MSSLEAYIEAYHSLLGNTNAARHSGSGLTPFATNGFSVFPPTTGLPLSVLPHPSPFMPPPFYPLTSVPIDVSAFGLMSPVMFPQYFASLMCDPSVAGMAAAAAAAFGGSGTSMAATADRSIAALVPNVNDTRDKNKVDGDLRSSNADVNYASIGKTHSMLATTVKKHLPAESSVTVSSSLLKDNSARSLQVYSQQLTSNSISPAASTVPMPTAVPSSPFGNSACSTQRCVVTAAASNLEKQRHQDESVTSLFVSDAVPLDFSTAGKSLTCKTASKSSNSSSVVSTRASVVVVPTSEKHTNRLPITSVVDTTDDELHSPADHRSYVHKPAVDKEKEDRYVQQHYQVSTDAVASVAMENGHFLKDGAAFNTRAEANRKILCTPVDALLSPPSSRINSLQPPLRLNANTVSLLKNVSLDSPLLVHQDGNILSSDISSTHSKNFSTFSPSPDARNSNQHSLADSVEKLGVGSQVANFRRKHLSRSDRKLRQPVISDVTATDLSMTAECSGASSASNGIEEFRCNLCNYSGRSQHCLTKHMRAHDVAYKICQYCHRAFERPSDLLRHEERHRRRDVTGAAPLAGGAVTTVASQANAPVTAGATALSCVSVGRVDSYSSGSLEWTSLLTVGIGSGDNEIVLEFDNTPSGLQLVERPPPEPSKLRDVYSIMAGIVVAHSLVAATSGQQEGVVSSTVPILDDDRMLSHRINFPLDHNIAFIAPSNEAKGELKRSCNSNDAALVDGQLESEKTAVSASAAENSSNCCSLPALEIAKKHRRKGKPVRASVEDTTDIGLNNTDSGNSISSFVIRKQAEKRSLQSAGPTDGETTNTGKCQDQRMSIVTVEAPTFNAVHQSTSAATKRSRLSEIIEKCRLQKRPLIVNGGQLPSERSNRLRRCKTDSNGNAVVVKKSCCHKCKRRFMSMTALLSHRLLKHRFQYPAIGKS